MAKRTKRFAFSTLRFTLSTLAFTLIEMLTVIAIIGILAAILIPTTQLVIKKSRMAAASHDISSINIAATSYQSTFGVFPPDRPTGTVPDSSGSYLLAPFPATLNPNECLMWYLTRQYSTGTPAQGVYGQPWNGDWNPATTDAVFSTVSLTTHFDIKAKQKKDIDGNGYCEFVDPWSRPYMYRAWMLPAANATVAAVNGANVQLTLASPSGYANVAVNLTNTVGSITLSGFPGSFNGTFNFTGSGSNQVNVTTTLPPGPGATGYYVFPLHNTQSCDIYSLGPYGRTRANSMPAAGEWKPTHGGAPLDNTSLDVWTQVWGTPGDGNDLDLPSGANTIIDSRYKDNICNWQ